MSLPVVHPDREPMSLSEARRVGAAANRIGLLREMLQKCVAGTLTIKTEQGSTQSVPLYSLDAAAILALLIEREGAFLTSFNVSLSEAPL